MKGISTIPKSTISTDAYRYTRINPTVNEDVTRKEGIRESPAITPGRKHTCPTKKHDRNNVKNKFRIDTYRPARLFRTSRKQERRDRETEPPKNRDKAYCSNTSTQSQQTPTQRRCNPESSEQATQDNDKNKRPMPPATTIA